VPIDSADLLHGANDQRRRVGPESADIAIAEIPALCQHLEGRLGLREAEPQVFGLEMLRRAIEGELPEGVLEDFLEPGMHTTWLVNEISAFEQKPGRTSERDLMLHYGIAYEEWRALFFDVLGIPNTSAAPDSETKTEKELILELDQQVPGYPMLSRIKGYLCDAVYSAEEARELQQECLDVRSATSDLLVLRGLDKLRRISREAQRLRLNIYLMAD